MSAAPLITFTMDEAQARLVMKAAQIAADAVPYGNSEEEDAEAMRFRALEWALGDALDRAGLTQD